jgi:uncharacterized protein YndB with AHSA1/START domain
MKQKPFTMTETFPISAEKMFSLWTNPEHLSQWFGPAGVELVQSTLDLKANGVHHFCMKTSDGHKMWGKWVFREIDPPYRLVWVHSFSDEKGGLTRHPLTDTWPLELLTTVTFEERGGIVTVNLEWITHNATESEQNTFDSSHESMQQGWGGTFSQLRHYVSKFVH